jgi:lipoprotein-releasing system permease protein
MPKLLSVPHVVGGAPAILGQGLISASRETVPVQVEGIDPALESQVTDLKRGMLKGSLDALNASDGPSGVLLGKDLAAKLGVGLGDSVSVVTLAGRLSPNGMMIVPRRLRVAGTFSLGLLEFDSTYAFVSLDTAKRLFDKDTVDFILLRVDDIWAAPAIARSITATLGRDYVANDWRDQNQTLFSALWLEKIAVSLAIGLIVMVAALNIVATLILLVMEKQRDIAILKTMGASARSATVIFMMQGLLIGLAGTATGAALGVGLCTIFDRYKLIRMPEDVYQVSYLPFTVLPFDFVLVVLVAVLICFVATIYPSRQAARLDPAQALRYE